MPASAPHLTVVGSAHAQSTLRDPQFRLAAVDVTGYPVAATNGHVRTWVSQRARAGKSLACVQLTFSDLSNLSLQGADLAHADLYGASLHGTRLMSVNFQNADLRLADLRGADMTGASLRGADLLGARIDATTDLSWVDWDEHTRWPEQFSPPQPVFGPVNI